MERALAERWSAAPPGIAAVAAVVLALSLSISSGMYHPLALAGVTVSIVLAGIAAWAAPSATGARGEHAAVLVLGSGLFLGWLRSFFIPPGVAPASPGAHESFRVLLGVLGLVLLTYAWRAPPRWLIRWRFPAMAAVAGAMGATMILAVPVPPIDVWHIQQTGAFELLHGRNPYSYGYPNIYGPGTPYLDPAVLSPDGMAILAYPYMPLVLLLDTPAALLGDVRWALLAAMLASAFLVRALGRGSRAAELAGSLLLVQPRGWAVVEMAWTEPYVLCGVLATALVVTRDAARPQDPLASPGGWIVPGAVAGLAASTKQYVPLLLVPFLPLLPARARLRAVLLAVGGAALAVLPFLLAGPEAFLRGVVGFQLRQPFRTDALSWPAAIHALGGPRIPPWPAFVVAGLALLVLLRREPGGARSMLAASFAWLLFVVLNKQAFLNYYWLAVGMLAASVALLTAPASPPPGPGRAAPHGAGPPPRPPRPRP
jgi:hypothetical protein